MSDYVSHQSIATAAGVDISTVSRVLSGKGKQGRIRLETQTRIWAVARQLGYSRSANTRFAKTAKSPAAPSPGVGASLPGRQIGLVISVSSPATTLAFIPRLEPVLASGGLKLVVMTLPADAAAGQQRVTQLAQECAGILCCPSVYPAVSAIVTNQRPVMVLWQEAGKAMLTAVGLVTTPVPQPNPVMNAPPAAVKPAVASAVVPVAVVKPPTPVLPPLATPAPVLPPVETPTQVAPPSPIEPVPEAETPPPVLVPEPVPVALPESPAPVLPPVETPTPVAPVLETELPPPVLVPEPAPVPLPETPSSTLEPESSLEGTPPQEAPTPVPPP
jgi:hypothetical protein